MDVVSAQDIAALEKLHAKLQLLHVQAQLRDARSLVHDAFEDDETAPFVAEILDEHATLGGAPRLR